MNIILFDKDELKPGMKVHLPKGDLRAFHIINILKSRVSDKLSAGIINGEQGQGIVESIRDGSLEITLNLTECIEKSYPLTLLIGISRPPTIKKILKEATALGVEEFILCGTEKGEKSYTQSKIFQADALQDVLIEGAQQAASTQLPKIKICNNLKNAMDLLPKTENVRLLALDNIRPSLSLTEYWAKAGKLKTKERICLAVGSERGWSAKELDTLEKSGFILCKMGDRILRTETASIAGCAICLSASGII